MTKLSPKMSALLAVFVEKKTMIIYKRGSKCYTKLPAAATLSTLDALEARGLIKAKKVAGTFEYLYSVVERERFSHDHQV